MLCQSSLSEIAIELHPRRPREPLHAHPHRRSCEGSRAVHHPRLANPPPLIHPSTLSTLLHRLGSPHSLLKLLAGKVAPPLRHFAAASAEDPRTLRGLERPRLRLHHAWIWAVGPPHLAAGRFAERLRPVGRRMAVVLR